MHISKLYNKTIARVYVVATTNEAFVGRDPELLLSSRSMLVTLCLSDGREYQMGLPKDHAGVFQNLFISGDPNSLIGLKITDFAETKRVKEDGTISTTYTIGDPRTNNAVTFTWFGGAPYGSQVELRDITRKLGD